MNTFLSAAQQNAKEIYLQYARENIAPVAAAIESHSISLKKILQELHQLGYLGITVPREYGGQGGNLVDFVLLAEAIARFEPGLGLTLANHVAVIEVIKRYGSDTQKSRYLPELARGEGLATLAFSEEQAGSDFEAVKTTIKPAGAAYVLDGKKVYVVSGELSSLALALAKDADGTLQLALVEMPPTGNSHIQPRHPMFGLRSACVNDLEFKELTVQKEALLAGSASAQEIALYAMDVAKVIVAAAALGLTEGAKEKSVKHSRSRRQFGSAIRSFQAIQWKLADLQTELTGATLQVYRAAWCHEANPADFRRAAAMCKWLATRTARVHCGEAIQVMGAKGLTGDEAMERFWRDAKAMEICQGTAEMQKVLLVHELDV